ncbi:chitobiase/beta-hexosaminidase C-terminal domain-containing protein, partial [bacterium]|nr:chitobiase/beta-hexosaminidase C-terminal domain-containing protein [bacterium]
YFSRPTPGAVNGEAYEEFLQPLVFSKDSGFYEDSFQLTITSPDEGVTIRYTLDATEPTASNGMVYSGPLNIYETTVIRAGVFKEGAYSPRPTARTFVFLDDVISQQSGARPGPKWPSGTINNQRFDYGMDTRITQSARYGDEMKAAFEQIPMLSIVTSPGNLFDSRTGIYVNAWQDGRNWERYAQLMYLTHDGSEGFNVGCGLRIRGGASRSSGNAKHSWRLFFRGEYGNSKLEYPLFGSEGALEFDKMDIRTAQNYSWSCEGGNDARENIMCRDVFARDLQREMGEPYTRSRYVHILLNGHYWGLYQFQERAEEHFAETYFGGDKDDFDVIKPDGYVAVVNSGTIDAWKSLWQMARDGFTEETYMKAIGRDPDGTRNPRFPVLLDPTNLADYTIINNFLGNTDGPLTMTDSGPNNFFAIYDRVRQGGFKYFCHDTEHAMVKMYLNTDKTGTITTGRDGTGAFNPRYLHQRLCAIDAYKRVFQSRVNLHYFNGGLLTPDRANWLLLSRVHEIDKAIICESARWGDVRTDCRSYQPLNRDDHWWPEIHWITNSFFPTRNTKNLEQFRNRGWYPRISPPRIYPNGGKVVAGTKVTMSGETYVKYTLDGTDPYTSETSKRYTGPITIDKPTYVRCTYDPAYSDTPMDVSAHFTLSEKSPLLVTELMYMPAPPEEGSPFEDKDYEFIELFNNSDKLFYPEGQAVTGGVDFVFAPGSKPIEPRSYVLLVKNPAAFAERYDTNDLYIAGTFEGSLSNDGEHLLLSNYDLSYSGYWFEDARGFGPSIVAARYDLNYADYSSKLGWRLSGEPYGSPGREDLPEPSLFLISLLALWGVRKLSF